MVIQATAMVIVLTTTETAIGHTLTAAQATVMATATQLIVTVVRAIATVTDIRLTAMAVRAIATVTDTLLIAELPERRAAAVANNKQKWVVAHRHHPKE